MSDIAVTVPKSFGLQAWIDEGDAAGEPETGQEWAFYLGGQRPDIAPGERVYVFYNGKLRGYAPLVRLERYASSYALIRRGGAVAVTIPEIITGFRGFRYRWWMTATEVPFPEWRTP